MRINPINSLTRLNLYNPLNLFKNFKKEGASILSDLVSDQKSIQNGSYSKLTAAYYKKKKENNDENEYSTYNSMGELVKNLEG